MTNRCKPRRSNCCRLCPSHRYEIQYRNGDNWIFYGYTKAGTGWPLKEKLEAEGKEVRVIDTEEELDEGEEPESLLGDPSDDSYTDTGTEPEEGHTRESEDSPKEPEGVGEGEEGGAE